MPNKTIYVADDQLALFDRAQELAGGNLSAAITRALARFVETQEGIVKGHQEITLTVGEPNRHRVQRFVGAKLVDWERPPVGEYGKALTEVLTIYQTAGGRFAVHSRRLTEFGKAAPRFWDLWADPRNWPDPEGRMSDTTQADLTVYDDLSRLEHALDAEPLARLRHVLSDPGVEDLDI